MSDKVEITPEAREAARLVMNLLGFGTEGWDSLDVVEHEIARAYQRKEPALKLADELAAQVAYMYDGALSCFDDNGIKLRGLLYRYQERRK